MTPDQFSYHLEEYKAVRQEIMFVLREIAIFEKGAILAVAGIYIFILGDSAAEFDSLLVQFAWWLPPVLIVVIHRRVEDYIRRVRILADYLVTLQGKIADPTIGGWESYVRSNPQNIRRNRSSDLTSRLVLAAVFFGSLALAFTYGWKP